jgi:hypothetical protein
MCQWHTITHHCVTFNYHQCHVLCMLKYAREGGTANHSFSLPPIDVRFPCAHYTRRYAARWSAFVCVAKFSPRNDANERRTYASSRDFRAIGDFNGFRRPKQSSDWLLSGRNVVILGRITWQYGQKPVDNTAYARYHLTRRNRV